LPEVLSLYELSRNIRSAIDTAFPGTFLVTAEIASLDIRKHCYMNLVEKDGEEIRADMRAVVWASRFSGIRADFKSVTGIDLAKGIKILFKAAVRFHERYGLSLDITAIDPSYTLGELSAKKKDVLERLSREGIRDRNKSLPFPLVPQRVGIVSSETSAGYEDLISHLTNNPYSFKFSLRLYEAVMQGDKAEESIKGALKRCNDDSSRLDLVVIVRGSGAQTDLHCFDSYEIARSIAFLGVPVISGIGHLRDTTVVDEVSNRKAKTPTAVADQIITRTKEFDDALVASAHRLVRGAGSFVFDMKERLSLLVQSFKDVSLRELGGERQRLDGFISGLEKSHRLTVSKMKYLVESSARLTSLAAKDIMAQKNVLNVIRSRIMTGSRGRLTIENERLDSRESNLTHLDPGNVMKRGYSITFKQGKPLKTVSGLKRHDTVRTLLYDGEVKSTVQEVSAHPKTD
jgi:exodeoxyribonuclease VII large subunit